MGTFINIIKEHIQYKHQIFKLAITDLIKTYRGAVLGWSWAIIKPAVTIFVYWFAFTVGLRAGNSVSGFPFFLWLIAGLIPWNYMNEMFISGMESMIKYRYLVTKIKFPISTIPTFVNISKTVIFLILLALVIIIFMTFGYMPDLYTLQVFFYMILAFIFFDIWSIFSSMLAAISVDFSNFIKAVLTAIFWLSGILWDTNKITHPLGKIFFLFNPITYLVNGFRNCFIYKIAFWEEPKKLGCFCIVLLVLTIITVRTYKKLRKEIPDVL